MERHAAGGATPQDQLSGLMEHSHQLAVGAVERFGAAVLVIVAIAITVTLAIGVVSALRGPMIMAGEDPDDRDGR